ncbi:MAG: ABC transporter substrate-binding protein, partial [Methylobacteriaceae bacterium]|nr:ABC transporter substrate-binding protein [Methylobacteriaceae bacterium]
IDDLTWEFKIRDGIKFHDGSPVTAADVVASINRIPLASTNSPSSFIAYVQDIAEASAPDSRTVRIKTKKPASLLLNNLTRVAILPAYNEKVPTDQLNAGKGVIGTGPFKFVSWAPDDNVTMERFDEYWDKPAKWDKVVFRVFKNSSARVAALLSGDVDIIDNLPTADMRHVQANKDIKTVTVSSNRVMYLHMDQERQESPFAKGPDGKNPLLNPNVRRALSLAINRDAIVERVMDGQGVPAGQMVPEGYFGWAPELKVDPYDPDKAKQLLAEAGVDNGFTLTFHASNDRYPNDSKVAQAIGQMFSRVGIKTEVVTLPGSVYFPRASALEFSLIMGGAAVETGEASGVLGPVLETFGPKAGQGNRGRYSNAEFDKALQDARNTLDDAERSRLLQKAMTISMTELGAIPVFFITNTWAMKKELSYPGRTDGYTLAYDVQ